MVLSVLLASGCVILRVAICHPLPVVGILVRHTGEIHSRTLALVPRRRACALQAQQSMNERRSCTSGAKIMVNAQLNDFLSGWRGQPLLETGFELFDAAIL